MPQVPIVIATPDDKPLVIVENLQLPAPAAGQEFSYVIPHGLRMSLNSLVLSFTTDSTIIVRNFRFVVASASGIIFFSHSIISINQSQTRNASFAPSLSYTGGTDVFPYAQIPCPANLTFEEGMRIYTLTDNLQAGDNYSHAVMQALTQYVKED